MLIYGWKWFTSREFGEDTKKEALGDNQRDGECYANGQLDGYDHTYPSQNIGKAVPHGIYDMSRNEAYVTCQK